MNDTGLPARRAALAALTEVEERGRWSNLAVPDALERLPSVRDRAFAASTLIFVLQYVADAQPLWSELRRVVAGPILVMQSMVALPSRRGILRFSDNLLGPAGCRAAAWAGYFGAEARRPRWRVERSFDRPAFDSWIRSFGLQARLLSAGPWPVGPIRHDLFRVEPR